MSIIDQLLSRMFGALEKAERIFLSRSPDNFSHEVNGIAWTHMDDYAGACQGAFEVLGPVRSLSICVEFMEDFLPQFRQLNPTDQSYAKALEHARQYIQLADGRLRELKSHAAPGDQSGNGRYLGPDEGPLDSTSQCYPVSDYETPGSLQFEFAVRALMWCIQDVHETGGTPFQSERHIPGFIEQDGWSWYCVRGLHASCIGDTLSAWDEVKWAELQQSGADLHVRAKYFYPLITEVWIGKLRYLAELIQNEARN